MHMQTILVDTSWLYNVREMFLLFIKFTFLWKNGVSEKIKAHLQQWCLGSRKDNPTMVDFGYSINAIRNQKHFKLIANGNVAQVAWSP